MIINESPEKIVFEDGIANEGNTNRILSLMQKALQGGQYRIGFIGGSITHGSLATTPQKCYAYRVYEWWCRTFPKAKFDFINAGIGGTTSQFGAARVSEDLLDKKPDFVIIEFSVNDESTEHFMETYEGLVRQVLSAAVDIAVMLVHNVCYNNGASAQLMHARIARRYNLPSVSMQSSIYKALLEGKICNREITPDDLHPNDLGHELVSKVIIYSLEKMNENINEMINSGKTVKRASCSSEIVPLTKNAYEDSVRYRNINSNPNLKGFKADTEFQKDITDCFKYGWNAENIDDEIVFEVEGSCIAVQYRKSVKLPAPIAKAIIDDDEKNAVILDANFDETWGDKLELTTLLEHGEKKKHKVKIKLIETHADDAASFYLVSVIGSGSK